MTVLDRLENSPGNRNGRVSVGDHAVLLFRVDHGGGNCQMAAGVDNRARSVGNKRNVDGRVNHGTFNIHF